MPSNRLLLRGLIEGRGRERGGGQEPPSVGRPNLLDPAKLFAKQSYWSDTQSQLPSSLRSILGSNNVANVTYGTSRPKDVKNHNSKTKHGENSFDVLSTAYINVLYE